MRAASVDRRVEPQAPVRGAGSSENRGDRTRTCNPRFWRPVRYQLRHAPGLRGAVYPGRLVTLCHEPVQRYALAVLFTAIATSLALVAVWSALEGGRAWVVAVAAAALAVWMADLAHRVWPSRQVDLAERQDETAAARRILLRWRK